MKKSLLHLKVLISVAVLLFGLFFLNWTVVELTVALLVETLVFFIVSEIDRHFISKTSKQHFIVSIFQVFFTSLLFLFGSFVYLMQIFDKLNTVESEHFKGELTHPLGQTNLLFIVLFFASIEITTYIIKKKNRTKSGQKYASGLFQRMFFSHMYIVFMTSLVSIYITGDLFAIIFIVGFHVGLAYVVASLKTEDKTSRSIRN